MLPFLHRTATKAMEENPLWLVVLCDIMTNLMLFFLIMYAFTRRPDEEKKKFLEGLSLPREFAFNGIRNKEERAGDLVQKFQETETSRALTQLFKRSGLENAAEVELTESQIRVRLTAPVLFPFGKAVLTPQARTALAPIGKLLVGLPNQVIIEGHTDNAPITKSPYQTNRELSIGRAYAVLQYLSKNFNLPETRFIIAGYGEFRPIESNSTKDGRAKNRRIEIVIMRQGAA